MKTFKRNHISGLIIIFTLILSSCGEKPQVERTGKHAVAVSLTPVITQKLVQPVYASGLTFSETEAVLSFKIGGIIQSIMVEEGDPIRKGQLLARLDLTEINAQVIQAQNGHEKAQRDLQRVKSLYQDDAATLENVQDLTTALNVAKETLRIAEFNQKFAEIRATTDGRVVSKLKNQGELVNPGMAVFFINDTSHDQWKLEAGVSDKDWARLNEGDQATLHFDAYPDEVFTGRVFRLAEGADPVNGSYQVEVQVDPQGRKMAAGLFAETKIIPSKSKSYQVIHIEALVEGYGKNGYVFVQNGGNGVNKIPVELAFILDNKVAIKKGLEHVDQVITAGSGYLTEFSSIQVIEGTDREKSGLTD